MTIRIKNWSKHQHFKDRTPPWIKLYREILDDPDWHDLDGESAKALVGLWLVASEDESRSGALPELRKLAFRLRVSESDLNQTLTKLKNWLIFDDISAISTRYQSDAPETETETETEGETEGEGETRASKKGRKTKTTKHPIPENFCVSDRVKAWAAEKGYGRLAEHLEAFTRKAKAKDYSYADWDSAFMEAIREDWAKLRGNGYKGAPTPDGYQPLPGEM